MKDAILPQVDSFISEKTKTELMPSYDWRLDVVNNRVRSEMVEDVEEVKQACYMMLSTEREDTEIYPKLYGRQFNDLFGKPPDYVCSVITSRIRDALTMDARIADVANFDFSIDGGDVVCRFQVELTDEAKESFDMKVVM